MKRKRINTGIKTFRFITALAVLSCIMLSATIAQKSETNKPEIKIVIKKEHDEKGNVIRYDSTYTYTWTNRSDTSEIDTVIKHIDKYFKFYSFGDDEFFIDSFKLPEMPSLPDFGPFYFFRFADSAFTWHHDLDSLFKHDFGNLFDEKDFIPFNPCDSAFFWPYPFKYKFPQSYFDEIEKYIEDIHENFEKDFKGMHFYYDTKPPKYFKQHYKSGKTHITTEI
jgi:hypothetical protein